MTEDSRPYQIRRLLYQNSRPALKAMDDQAIARLVQGILSVAVGCASTWTKWGKEREEIARRAVDLWVPLEDLGRGMNGLPRATAYFHRCGATHTGDQAGDHAGVDAAIWPC
jgi:hypothetical protein